MLLGIAEMEIVFFYTRFGLCSRFSKQPHAGASGKTSLGIQ